MKRFASTRLRRLFLVIILASVPLAPAGTAAAFSGGGTGTGGDPYQITTCAELDSINVELTADYVIENDIDCSGAAALNGGTGWVPIGQGTSGFQGILDGQNHKINNLDLSALSDTLDDAGMFDSIAGSGLVENLRIMEGKVNGHRGVGMVVGEMFDTSILSGVYASATVTCHNENCGGLVGAMHDSAAIENSGADVTMTDDGQSAGGLVGWIAGSNDIEESYANGTVSSGTNNAGGLVGAVNNGLATATINNAYTNVTVTASGDDVGGIAGLCATVNISDVYAAGSVTGGDSVGGIAGLYVGTMTNVFAVNSVTGTGSNVGPVTGDNFGTVTNGYFDTNKTGFSSSSDGSTAVTDSSLFIDNDTNAPMSTWDFSTIWRTNYNDYPSFAPLIDPYMLCEAPHSTNTTISGHCMVLPLGWGTPAWVARWSPHDANKWHTITLSNTHQAIVTVTGLTPGTWYDLEFRFTNDFGTGPWGKVVILTTGSPPAVHQVTDTSSGTEFPFGFVADTTPAASDKDTTPPTTSTSVPITKTPAGNSKAVGATNSNAFIYLWSGGSILILLVIGFVLFRPKHQ